MNKKLFLIDGSSFLYRAYYGLQPLHTASGKTVQAVYGFCRMIKKLADSLKPEHMILVWDSKGKTLRHEIFDQYKATRQAPPSDLFEQKEYIKKFAQLIKLAQVEQVGVEADDLIGSLAQDFVKNGYEITIISSDKDLSQLLGTNIKIFDPFKNQEVTAESFEKITGFSPSNVPFYYALLGDSSDNIPGVTGIGKQGALQLVQKYSSLDDVYANIETIEPKRIKTALIAGKEAAYLSLELFKLRTFSVDISEQDSCFDEKNFDKACPLFEELGFKSLIKLSEGVQTSITQKENTSPQAGADCTFVCVTNNTQLAYMISQIRSTGAVAIDTETTGISTIESALVGISFCCKPDQAWYVPLVHATEQCLSKEFIVPVICELLADQSIKKIMHHAKFDLQILYGAGFNVQNLYFDTMVAASLLVPEWQKVGLKALSQTLLNEHMLTYDEVVTQNKYPDFSHVPLAQAVEYAAADALQTFKLWKLFEQQLDEHKLTKLYYELEHPLIIVLQEMECEGIYCDRKILDDLAQKAQYEIKIIEDEIYGLTGLLPGSLNLNSPKQLEQLLFGTLQLSPQKMSVKKTGFSTDQEVLEKLSQLHVVPKLILKHRELSKLHGTYLMGLTEAINAKTNKIHTSFRQSTVATGRLSSSDPNLQNIPVQVGEITVRSAFKAPIGYSFISADYSQIELRVLAYLADEHVLTESFLCDHDIHAITASKLFNVLLEQVTQEQRQVGKRINFSVLYGLTPFGLARDLNISTTESKKYIDTFFAQYPSVKLWMDQVTAQAVECGYVTTWMGRRRFVPGIREKNKHLFEAARRVAINTVAQGTAAEIMKLGMIRIHDLLQTQKVDAKILLQIHDELLIQVSDNDCAVAQDLVKKTLERVVDWDVPLKVTLRAGKTWQDVTK